MVSGRACRDQSLHKWMQVSGVDCCRKCGRLVRGSGILGVFGDGGSDLNCGSIGVVCLWIWSVHDGELARVFGGVFDLVRCATCAERLVDGFA